jgi:hypothetical protein
MFDDSRRRFEEALQGLLAAPGRALDDRFGIYRTGEQLIEAAAGLHQKARPTRAWLLAGPATRARWDLHGLLLPLEPVLDEEPEPGEWSVRKTLTHMLHSQRFWAWLFGLWADDAGSPGVLPRPRGAAIPDQFRRPPEALPGTVAELRGELDLAMDASFLHLADLAGAGHLQTRVPFNLRGGEVPVEYYPLRWAGHLWEHTIQIEKALDRPASEAERMVRVLARAWGDLEAAAMLAPPPQAELAVAEAAGGVQERLQQGEAT